ncbi:hypothetical protein RDI58_016011 [Solanum bulbocastanum]|uniref:Uncharacterized protein n=1 Tax=Solanum bulbocastanum TaxID=147425 RepID=A0AAN8TL49_SOLBU
MVGKSMKDMLTKSSSKMSKDGKVEIEVSEWFLSLSEDVITHTVFGSSCEDGKPIVELQAQQLVYATNAFHQVFIPGFRLYPPLAATICRAKIDTKLGTLNLPQGTDLLIPFIGIHHDAELWGDDVNEFNPGRFARGHGVYAFRLRRSPLHWAKFSYRTS